MYGRLRLARVTLPTHKVGMLGQTQNVTIPFRTLFSVFLRIGLLSFGGPAAQIALMHRSLVEERRWISEAEFLSALSFCMLFPGPEAMQLATWTGWRLKDTGGGLVAGLLFVLPGAVVVLATQGTAPTPSGPRPWGATGQAVAIWGTIWLLPLAALVVLSPSFYAEVAVFFSKLAVVTFGGAYAVLGWMSQAVVEEKHWLTLPQMIDALGLAETTLGPLILVTEFVAYVAGYHKDGLRGGLAAALITLWMTFAPCFLWIFTAGAWLERITKMPRLSGALTFITASVVGVIAHLSLWFAAHVIFAQVGRIDLGPIHMIWPQITSLRPMPTVLALWLAYLLLQL